MNQDWELTVYIFIQQDLFYVFGTSGKSFFFFFFFFFGLLICLDVSLNYFCALGKRGFWFFFPKRVNILKCCLCILKYLLYYCVLFLLNPLASWKMWLLVDLVLHRCCSSCSWDWKGSLCTGGWQGWMTFGPFLQLFVRKSSASLDLMHNVGVCFSCQLFLEMHSAPVCVFYLIFQIFSWNLSFSSASHAFQTQDSSILDVSWCNFRNVTVLPPLVKIL